jgi:ribonuclease J
MTAAAKSVGLFADTQGFITEQEAGHFPSDKVLYLCTGSQGEVRAALSRIATGTHPHVTLGKGDHCIFSSRQIPGNEVSIRNLMNNLAERGVRLYTERDHPGIHVSGHPCRDELRQMYKWARPTIAIPTHGERRHLLEHVALATEMGTPQALAPRNGDMVRLAPGRAEVIDEVPSGRLYVDGGLLTPENGSALRERRHAASNGMLMISLALDAKGRLVSGPEIRAIGLPDEKSDPLEDNLDDLADAAEDAIKRMDNRQREDDDAVEAAVARTVKRASQRIWDRKPIVETLVLRV